MSDVCKPTAHLLSILGVLQVEVRNIFHRWRLVAPIVRRAEDKHTCSREMDRRVVDNAAAQSKGTRLTANGLVARTTVLRGETGDSAILHVQPRAPTAQVC